MQINKTICTFPTRKSHIMQKPICCNLIIYRTPLDINHFCCTGRSAWLLPLAISLLFLLMPLQSILRPFRDLITFQNAQHVRKPISSDFTVLVSDDSEHIANLICHSELSTGQPFARQSIVSIQIERESITVAVIVDCLNRQLLKSLLPTFAKVAQVQFTIHTDSCASATAPYLFLIQSGLWPAA